MVKSGKSRIYYRVLCLRQKRGRYKAGNKAQLMQGIRHWAAAAQMKALNLYTVNLTLAARASLIPDGAAEGEDCLLTQYTAQESGPGRGP